MKLLWLVLGAHQIHGDLQAAPPLPRSVDGKTAAEPRSTPAQQASWSGQNPLQIRAVLWIHQTPIGEVFPGQKVSICGLQEGAYEAEWRPPSGSSTMVEIQMVAGPSECLDQLQQRKQSQAAPLGR